jgi:hypothetical protein
VGHGNGLYNGWLRLGQFKENWTEFCNVASKQRSWFQFRLPLRFFIRLVKSCWRALCSWPPWTDLFRSDPFYVENIIYHFYKTYYLNEEANCTELNNSLPSVSILWLDYRKEVHVIPKQGCTSYQGILTEGEGSVQLSSSWRKLVL